MGFYLIIALVIISVIYIFSRSSTVPTDNVEYSQVIRYFEEDKVAYFKLEGDELTMRLNEIDENTGREKIVTHTLANVEQFWNDCGETITALRVSSKDFQYDYTTGWSMPWWVSLVPYVLIFVVFIVIWSMMMKNYGGVGGDRGVTKFGKAHTRLGSEEKHRITFADVAGAEEEKEELWEIVDFLRNPQKYTALGARIPKGVLLVGPPGTGKTLLAKAVAGEAGVQFLSISGSDFVELYVGVGASRVRDLFEQAKKLAPAIIFIDEIDAVGRQRGAGLGGGHDEREQTLNQLLVEMDGFTSNEGVIVIAATNRADILDNALLRPGRFDRQVFVAPPDIRGREEILKVHARGKMLAEDVDLSSIAKGTPGFTGADLENLLNEAALLSARRRKPFISKAEIEDAILKVMAGPEKKSRVVTEKERRLTAYHEAGHAVVAHFLEHADPVHHITIIPHGAAGGMTVYRPVEDKSFNSKSDMFERIITALGGRISEKIMLDDISTGASNDIQQASAIARAMVTKYGMSDRLGPISYDSSSNSIFIGRDFQHTKSYSEETAALIDEEVKRIFDEASARCEEILSAHRNIIESVAGYLLEHETMDGKDFAYVCDHDGELPPVQEPAQQPESPAGAFSETTSVAEQELPGQMPQQPVTDTDFVDITPPEDGENPFETEEK
ncbi:MAG: ATP-dependent zinc metalloprotease FtsH [Oscillospiraceae bacterium]|nr:ATP-dependent zinc metalloprotease FtsH [Oscillospiraceae bacterium]